MIVSFSVENFRSFDSEATLSLVASNRLAGEHGNHAVAIPGASAKVLRTAVIYGANGAGKSNLFKALTYLQSLVVRYSGRENKGTGRDAFRFGARSDTPSAFDLQFIAEQRLYRYIIKLDDRQVTEEWLGETIDGRERMIFQRGQDRDVVLGDQVKGHKRLVALATVGAAPNQSFLRTVGIAVLPRSDVGPELVSVQRWFWAVLDLVSPGESQMSLWRKLNEDPSLLDFASGFLRSSSTGVDRLEILKSQISPEELSGFVGENIARQLVDLAETGGPRFVRAGRVAGDAWIEIGGDEGYRLVRFQSAHKSEDGRTFNMDLDDESDGTRRLLDLLPALHQIQNRGGVYFVDEIDRSMHPILVRRFLEFFLSSCADSPSQLIVTTHESNLLDLSLLRRDEIWFAEKDHGQATHLYSLAEFQVRKDLEIRKHYLQGRFGAIPFLGNIEQLTKGPDETA
jgi:AAA15 family ATPase/GTPase